MDSSYTELIESIIKRLDKIPYIHPEDLPDLDLYMDQVRTIMEEKLSATRRNEKDKILTKTMINNYAKNHILPPPIKKKYSREHMFILVFIYYFKGILSLQDIQKLIGPLTRDITSGSSHFDIQQIFSEVSALQREQIPRINDDLNAILESSSPGFSRISALTMDGAEKSDSEYLKVFSIICSLAVDVFVKKRVIEELIDSCL